MPKAYERVNLARNGKRPNFPMYIDELFDNFFECHGDRLHRDDHAILGGIALFDNKPVTVIGHLKGRTLEENIACNFGMPSPEGYRKAVRLMKQAEKFNRPIITFVDTPGAYPGVKAEENGQGEAIARNLLEMSQLTVPVISIIIGEGCSGGALAIAVANQVWMLENSVYSVLSPEGFSSILWKDATLAERASEVMKLTAYDLQELDIIERIVPESPEGIALDFAPTVTYLKNALREELHRLQKISRNQLAEQRYEKFRKVGRP